MNSKSSYASFAIAMALALVVLLAPAVGKAAPRELSMGMVAADDPALTLKRWVPIVDLLSKKIGLTVKPVVLDDYASIIWHLASGKIQFAWGGNKFAIEAVDRANSEVIAKTIHVASGGGYYSHLIVRKDSPLESLDDVLANASDITFGNGDPNSTSGFVVPGYYIFAKNDITPQRIFKRMKHNNHEGNFHAVVSGEVDVATNNSLAIGRYTMHYPDKATQIKTIWTSPLIPSDPIVMRKDMDPQLRKKILDFFTSFGKAGPDKTEEELVHEQTLLAQREWQGFIPSDNSQLKPIRKLELFKKKLQIERDSSIPEAVKQRRLEEMEKQLGKLDS